VTACLFETLRPALNVLQNRKKSEVAAGSSWGVAATELNSALANIIYIWPRDFLQGLKADRSVCVYVGAEGSDLLKRRWQRLLAGSWAVKMAAIQRNESAALTLVQSPVSHFYFAEALSQGNQFVTDFRPFDQIESFRIFEMGFGETAAGFAGELSVRL
jgi:hypothetical protein